MCVRVCVLRVHVCACVRVCVCCVYMCVHMCMCAVVSESRPHKIANEFFNLLFSSRRGMQVHIPY